MQQIIQKIQTYSHNLQKILNPKIVSLFILGFGSGLPLLLIFSTLSIWLTKAGLSKSDVTFFSWAALGYGFKYIWVPLIDRMPFPIIGAILGQRRGWLIASQLAIMLSLCAMGLANPETHIVFLALAAVMLGFSSATQDIAVDAYRIEIADSQMQGLLTAAYIAGYRVAMIVSGALALELVAYLQDDPDIYQYAAWRTTYWIMASLMLVPMLAVFFIKESKTYREDKHVFNNQDYTRFFIGFLLAILALVGIFSSYGKFITPALALEDLRYLKILNEFIRLCLGLGAAYLVFFLLLKLDFISKLLFQTGYLEPVKEIFNRYPLFTIIIILLTIGCYRAPDIIMGTSANIFYVDMGYSLQEIGRISKAFGLIMTILGGFLAGIFMVYIGVSISLCIGVVLAASSNLLFAFLSGLDASIPALTMTIIADNISAGWASVAFVAWLSRLTNIKFTAMQYAIYSSLMVVGPKFIGGYSGTMIENMGYASFYVMTALIGVPVFILTIIAVRLEANNIKLA